MLTTVLQKLGSKTPGHPESTDTPGVEVTTGPLGQGFSNAVGLAIAQAHTAAVFNKPGYDLVDNYTYLYFGDGCAMEGIASEAASTAGHLQLGNLIAIYDDNHISIVRNFSGGLQDRLTNCLQDGDTNCAFTEDVLKRFEAYGWHTLHVKDGDHDLEGIEKAIAEAKAVTDKPSVIKLTTTIGFGSKLEGTGGVHGNPLKAEDAKNVKVKFGFDPEKSFDVPSRVYEAYGETASKGAAAEEEWKQLFSKYKGEYPKEAEDFSRRLDGRLPEGWEKHLPTQGLSLLFRAQCGGGGANKGFIRYKSTDAAVASRKLSETVLTKLYSIIPELIGGSADLTGSNLTRAKEAIDFQPPSTKLGDYAGRYIRYGVREHAMAGIMNGLAAYGTIIPFGGTFLNFVSYAAGSVRLSALSHVRCIHVATHDSYVQP